LHQQPRRPISVVLSSPGVEGDLPEPHNELVLSVDDPIEPLTVGDIKRTIADTHKIPILSIALFKDEKHTEEYRDNTYVLPTSEGLKIYWAFIGDAPHTWISKANEISGYVDDLINQITNQMDSSCFFLENDFYFEDGMSHSAKRNQWNEINKLPHPTEQPRIPVKIQNGKYLTETHQIEKAYADGNIYWKKTRDEILGRLSNIRTDKLQYEKNLESLRSNDSILREKVTTMSGKLFPPFPDTALYSSIFYTKERNGLPPDLILASLFTAIESNTIYYHQELGKYAQLKKEECHLIEKYLQIQTRMKLWIARERIRLVAWELWESDAYNDDDLNLKLRLVAVESVPPAPAIPDIRKTFQCVDFCQCEAGCATLIRSTASISHTTHHSETFVQVRK